MVPGSTILKRPPLVREALAWSDGALSNAVNAVHGDCTELANAMPVDRGAIVLQVVEDCHPNVISPAGLEPGSRILSIKHL